MDEDVLDTQGTLFPDINWSLNLSPEENFLHGVLFAIHFAKRSFKAICSLV